MKPPVYMVLAFSSNYAYEESIPLHNNNITAHLRECHYVKSGQLIFFFCEYVTRRLAKTTCKPSMQYNYKYRQKLICSFSIFPNPTIFSVYLILFFLLLSNRFGKSRVQKNETRFFWNKKKTQNHKITNFILCNENV